MKIRLGSFLMSLIILLGVLFLSVPTVYAQSDLTTSEECISLIKEFEGFSKNAFFDYSQWSIGYGTACNKSDYPNGITREKADELLRANLATLEKTVNKFAKSNGLNLSQHQFDALISFSYNVGSSWMYDNKQVITKAVINGSGGNDFLFALTRWCIVTENGTRKIATSLINRRLIEANMYLNGVYVNSVPSNYKYVIYEDNIDSCITDTRVQGYDNTVTDVLRAAPTKSGYSFLGWYTQPNGGQWITRVGPDISADRLYAHWQQGTDDTAGVAANYTRYGTGGNIYGYPAFSSTVVGTLGQGESAVVMAEYMDANGVKWGKLATGMWICISETLEKAASSGMNPIAVTVICDTVNIRTGPGTGYDKAGALSRGRELLLTEVQQNGNYKWGRFEGGWICLDYTDYDQVLSGTSGSTSGSYEEGSSGSAPNETVVAKGKVGKCTSLRIRSGAGTNYDTVGSLYTGDQVEIYEIETVSGMRWGRTGKGWICLSYVQLESGGSSSSAVTGTVISCTRLNVRAAPGVSNAKVCALNSGAVVTIYEQATVDGDAWGRIDQGWVHMGYVYVGDGAPSTGSSGYTTGTVYNTDALRIRSGAGTHNEKVGLLSRGTVVIITETTQVGSTTWGRIDQGWISLKYVQVSDGSVPVDSTTRTINTKSLRIRAGAGTNYDCLGSYTMGQQVVITEETNVTGRPWGRTDRGWICLDYVI